MEFTIKGALLKKATINEDGVKVGKKVINMNDITEVKYQMATVTLQGFLTFCTETEGKNIKSLNDVSINKNSIMFYRKQNENVINLLSFFDEKGIKLTNIIEAQKQQKIEAKKTFKAKAEELDRMDILYCPKCHSQNVVYQNNKLSVGRAVVGDALYGDKGAILGGLTGKKGILKCLKCGHTWDI
ncbi:hypothetical protein [Metaclostridioides mangenotii]|uniref:hypothetical protein n=1 Tax=Metaclostridioides mangenotii TaxID=1540 RepID=UPI00068C5FCC|nr:hypothetical protein [Clostridioides mangenotii]